MSDPFKYIPLLSGKPLDAFTPEEFQAYVRSLNYVKTKKTRGKVVKPPPPEVSWSVNKKGTLSVKIRRSPIGKPPKVPIKRMEIELIARESKRPLNEVWLKLVGPKGKARVMD